MDAICNNSFTLRPTERICLLWRWLYIAQNVLGEGYGSHCYGRYSGDILAKHCQLAFEY